MEPVATQSGNANLGNLCCIFKGKRGGLEISALDSEASGQGLSPVVFLGKTLYSHSTSPHPGV